MLDFQFWSDRSWQSFNQSEQHALNTNFSQTPRPDSVNLGLREVKNFSQVHQGHAEQKNKSTGKLRWVRIKPPYQIDGGVQPHLPPLFHFCHEENGTWFPFNQEHQAELVSYAKSAPPPGQVVFYIRGQEYVLLGMDALVKDANAACMQVNVFTNRTRIVRIQSGPAPVVPAPAFSMGPARHSVRSVSGALGGGSHSSSGYGYNPRSSASASAPSSFSLSSAVFLVETANGRKHLSSHWADEIRRHWRMSPRPDQALECGSAVLRSRDGAQKLEVRLESQIGPGSLIYQTTWRVRTKKWTFPLWESICLRRSSGDCRTATRNAAFARRIWWQLRRHQFLPGQQPDFHPELRQQAWMTTAMLS